MKKYIVIFIWVLIGGATVALLVAARRIKESKLCSSVNIEVEGKDNEVFINEQAVLKIVNNMGGKTGAVISTINLKNIEQSLLDDEWIHKAKLYFDNNQVLQVKLAESEPIARIFTIQGSSFYIDSSLKKLPLSSVVTARVPVFTSFTSDKDSLSHPDSLLLYDVKRLATFIAQDTFWFAQVAQIDITPNAKFEMIPTIGNQVIVIGDADSLDAKFGRLYSFYKQVWAKTGFDKYDRIDIQYDKQVVARKRATKSATANPVNAAANTAVQAIAKSKTQVQQANDIVQNSTVKKIK
ncbi:MAG: hypothetical protein LBE82_02460 [Chitinophagaceae bacterium]|jgi:cell division protein FtsQ|nr:hypothetical protein [Chitinophagaceae bacterium]